MTLTLTIPSSAARADAEYQAKLRRAADALRDADLITPEQAAELMGEKAMTTAQAAPPAPPAPLRQGSPEWRAELRRLGEDVQRTEPLTIEQTSREVIYQDDIR